MTFFLIMALILAISNQHSMGANAYTNADEKKITLACPFNQPIAGLATWQFTLTRYRDHFQPLALVECKQGHCNLGGLEKDQWKLVTIHQEKLPVWNLPESEVISKLALVGSNHDDQELMVIINLALTQRKAQAIFMAFEGDLTSGVTPPSDCQVL